MTAVIAYFPSWKSDAHPVPHIPATMLTHVCYAFAGVSPEGFCTLPDEHLDLKAETGFQVGTGEGTLKGNFAAFRHLKAQHPHLKLLVSIGGWMGSQHFSHMARTAESRAKFIESAISQFLLGCVADVFPEHAAGIFDGFDLDWEYPTQGGPEHNHHHPEDAHHFTLLMQEFRAALDLLAQDTGQTYELSVAVPAAPERLIHDFDLKGLSHFTDRIHLMTYDFTGEVQPLTTFHNNLFAVQNAPLEIQYSAHQTVQTAIHLGVPPEKLVLGIPFYGRMWKNLPSQNTGLFQKHSGECFDGDLDYRLLVQEFLDSNQRFTPYYHLEAEVPYLFDAQQGTFITFENPRSIKAKIRYLQSRNLQGVMFWELTQDNGELLRAIHQTLDP